MRGQKIQWQFKIAAARNSGVVNIRRCMKCCAYVVKTDKEKQGVEAATAPKTYG